jgi:hypothetical protein
MIATQKDCKRKRYSPRWNDRFLQLLPAIQDQAEFAFRRVPSDAREELVQETVATAYGLFVTLCHRGRAALAYPTPLTKFAVRHVREGRRIGSRCNSRDILSPHASGAKRIKIERLVRFDQRKDEWREVLLEDRTAGPDKIAATRIDFAAWLKTLSRRDRKIAGRLAIGESTGTVARAFRISSARISQLRCEFFENWHRFVGEMTDAVRPSVATA